MGALDEQSSAGGGLAEPLISKEPTSSPDADADELKGHSNTLKAAASLAKAGHPLAAGALLARGGLATTAMSALLTVGGLATSAIAMISAQGAITVYVAGAVCMLNSGTVAAKERVILKQGGLKQIINEMKGQANLLGGEVNKLEGNVDKLEGDVNNLKHTEEALNNIAQAQGSNCDELVALLKENAEIIKKQKTYLKEAAIADISKIVLMSDQDGSMTIDKKESKQLTLRVSLQLDAHGINLNFVKFMKMVKENNDITKVLKLVQAIMFGETIEGEEEWGEEPMFTMKQKSNTGSKAAADGESPSLKKSTRDEAVAGRPSKASGQNSKLDLPKPPSVQEALSGVKESLPGSRDKLREAPSSVKESPPSYAEKSGQAFGRGAPTADFAGAPARHAPNTNLDDYATEDSDEEPETSSRTRTTILSMTAYDTESSEDEQTVVSIMSVDRKPKKQKKSKRKKMKKKIESIVEKKSTRDEVVAGRPSKASDQNSKLDLPKPPSAQDASSGVKESLPGSREKLREASSSVKESPPSYAKKSGQAFGRGAPTADFARPPQRHAPYTDLGKYAIEDSDEEPEISLRSRTLTLPVINDTAEDNEEEQTVGSADNSLDKSTLSADLKKQKKSKRKKMMKKFESIMK